MSLLQLLAWLEVLREVLLYMLLVLSLKGWFWVNAFRLEFLREVSLQVLLGLSF